MKTATKEVAKQLGSVYTNRDGARVILVGDTIKALDNGTLVVMNEGLIVGVVKLDWGESLVLQDL